MAASILAIAACGLLGAGAARAQAGDISQPIGDLPVGKRVHILFQGEVVEPVSAGATEVLTQGTVSGTNFASVSTDDPDLGGAADPTATALVNTSPQLSIAKDDGGVSVAPGDTIAYTLDYQNTGNQDAGAVEIEETVPDDTSFNAGASTAGWVCVPDASAGSVCTLSIGLVAGSGGSGSATFAVDVDDPVSAGTTEISNTAEILDGATSFDSDSDTTPLILGFDLELLKIDTLEPVRAGTVQVYSYLVTNLGPASADGVELDDVLPVETTFVASSPGAPTCVEAAGAFHCDLGTLASGESAEVVVMVLVDGDFEGTITNNAVVSASEPDLDPGNDTAAEPTLVEAFRKAVAVPDLNTSLSSELAVLLRDASAMTTELRVRDSETGDLLLTAGFPAFAGWDPIDLAMVPSIGTGAGPGVAVLLRDPITHQVKVVVKSLTTGLDHAVISYPPRVPVGLAVFVDFDASGADEVGVLFKRSDTGAVFVTAKDSSSGAVVSVVSMNLLDIPVDLAPVPNFAGSPAPEAAFLLRRGTTRLNKVVLRDMVSVPYLKTLFFDPDHVPLSVLPVTDFDANLFPEIGVLSKGRTDTTMQVELKDSSTAATKVLDFSLVGLDVRPIGFATVPDFGGGGFDEIVVAGRREDNVIAVRVRDSATGASLLRQGWGRVFSPLDLLILDDFGATLAPEIGVFRRRLSNDELEVRVKDGSSGVGLSTVDFP